MFSSSRNVGGVGKGWLLTLGLGLLRKARRFNLLDVNGVWLPNLRLLCATLDADEANDIVSNISISPRTRQTQCNGACLRAPL
ncbi:MAG: hypothetical protein QOG23_651 [Blastocatellia bacterium]|nr:hypothetical protein [Blastocatellia bacterium]